MPRPSPGGSPPLRVAMLAPISWRVPPRHYGPWERVTSILTEGLVARGVEVTLFATADSQTAATLSAVVPRPYSEDPSLDVKVAETLHCAAPFERAQQFDVIHNHFDFAPLAFSRLVETPLITTIHGFSSDRILPVYRAYDDVAHYVAISDADRRPDLTYAATIHHGVPMHDFTPRDRPGDYLVFLGRIHPDKGAHLAVELALATGRRLVIAGIVQDEDYHRTRIVPHLDGRRIRYIGSVGPSVRDRLLGGALALVHLIDFEEPFGLSVVEAMAAGTPVIAHPRGSMPELVDEGLTGFLVDDLGQAAAAVDAAGQLDRRRCRAHAETRFSATRMIDDYLALYRRIVDA